MKDKESQSVQPSEDPLNPQLIKNNIKPNLSNKVYMIIGGAVTLAILFWIVFYSNSSFQSSKTIVNIGDNSTGVITTENQLALHNTINDCWIAYSGKVYDITSFLPKHPGSAKAISPYCGTAKEFEEAFTKKHGTTKVALLMKVGVLIGDFKIKGNLS